jgi:hypothetical protein
MPSSTNRNLGKGGSKPPFLRTKINSEIFLFGNVFSPAWGIEYFFEMNYNVNS